MANLAQLQIVINYLENNARNMTQFMRDSFSVLSSGVASDDTDGFFAKAWAKCCVDQALFVLMTYRKMSREEAIEFMTTLAKSE